MKPNAQTLILGGTTWDHIIQLPEFPGTEPKTIHQAVFFEGTGSTGAGKALPLHQLGVPCSLYSVLGDDYYGKQVIDFLTQRGLTYRIITDPAGTERHVNLMNHSGERISIFITNSTEQVDHDFEWLQQAIDQADVIVLNIISYCKALAPIVKQSGKPVWTDLHDYDGRNSYHQPFIDAASHIHLSSDSLPDYRSLMQQFIENGKELVVCTHGKAGATLLDREGNWLEQEALTHFPQVDTNGAGDHFFAGFYYGWIGGKSGKHCLELGAVAAALCVGSRQISPESLNAQTLQSVWSNQFGK